MKLSKIIRSKMSISRFCRVLKIKNQTYYAWIKTKPKILEKLLKISEIIGIYDIRDLNRLFDKE